MGMDAKTAILEQKTALGIELGSTRIKAVLIGADNAPITSGDHEWENRYDNGVWTYTLEDIWTGLQDAYTKMAADVKEKYDITLTRVGAIGFSAMMHGYMAFDKAGNLLVPFRTWRNNITEEASEKLTDLFGFHIPQRWTIAHLYQAILNGGRLGRIHRSGCGCALRRPVRRLLQRRRVTRKPALVHKTPRRCSTTLSR